MGGQVLWVMFAAFALVVIVIAVILVRVGGPFSDGDDPRERPGEGAEDLAHDPSHDRPVRLMGRSETLVLSAAMLRRGDAMTVRPWWIVMRLDRPGPREAGSGAYREHGSAASAVTEARRLASASPDEQFILWIGMNPSTASADVDDLTCRKEWVWSTRAQFRRYVKMNIGTYRATDPRDLAQAAERGEAIVVDGHQDEILGTARSAGLVVLATGQVPRCLDHEAQQVFAMLRREVPGKLRCLGLTVRGYPKHPARLGYDNALRTYR